MLSNKTSKKRTYLVSEICPLFFGTYFGGVHFSEVHTNNTDVGEKQCSQINYDDFESAPAVRSIPATPCRLVDPSSLWNLAINFLRPHLS